MAGLTVALLQMLSHGVDQDANLAKADAFCRRAYALGAAIVLFPEMWNIGYTSFYEEGGPSDFWRAPERWGDAPGNAFHPRAAAMATWQSSLPRLTWTRSVPGGNVKFGAALSAGPIATAC